MKNVIIKYIADLDHAGKVVLRAGIVIVFLWIGGLKFFTYEADGIVPFVANSPFMSFLYKDPGAYKKHINKEGEINRVNHTWQLENGTYILSEALGVFLVTVALLVAFYKVTPLPSMIASMLIVIMTIGTLSFLITTPEAWVPNLGDTDWGFPYLSGRGRLVLKDIVIMGGAIINMSESAALYLRRTRQKNEPV